MSSANNAIAMIDVKKPRKQMTEEAKVAMAAKRAATLAAKQSAAPVPAPAPAPEEQEAEGEDGKKARKPREKMTETAKAAMAAKRAATLAAKNGIAPALVPTAAPVPEAEAVEPKATTPPAPKGKKAAPGAPKKGKKEATPAEDKPMSAPKAFTLVEVDGSFFMVHNESQKVYRANLDKEGDDRAEMDQQAGLFKDGEILPIFDEDE